MFIINYAYFVIYLGFVSLVLNQGGTVRLDLKNNYVRLFLLIIMLFVKGAGDFFRSLFLASLSIKRTSLNSFIKRMNGKLESYDMFYEKYGHKCEFLGKMREKGCNHCYCSFDFKFV